MNRAGRAFVFALPLAYGVMQATRGAWLCDDVFVSFRYIDQWMHGHGLVFNPGERVEGYTHFLWVALLGMLHRLGFDLEFVGRFLPIAAWAAVLGVLLAHSLRASGSGRAAWLALPVAAWSLAAHRDAQIFASSGLETSFFALLLLAGVLCTTSRRARLDAAGACFALATLVRPEGLMYALAAAGWSLWRRRDRRELLHFAFTFSALLVPFVVWKLAYYGTLVPNTFYAKSAHVSYWSQGWLYARMYFYVYPVLVLGLAVAVAGWAASRPWRASAGSGARRDLAELALVQVLLTLFYVVRVGGDFMFARFFIPMTPLAYLAAEETIRHTRRAWVMPAFSILAIGGTLAARIPRARLLHGCDPVGGIVDESRCYSDESTRELRRQGEVLGHVLEGTRVRLVLPPGRTMLAYFGRLPYAVEGAGLTDASIARLPLERRGRPGHEKGPSDDWMRAHHVPFRILYGAHRSGVLKPYERAGFGDVHAQMVYYDAAVIESLAGRRGVTLHDFRAYLEGYLGSQLGLRPGHLLLEDYAHFKRFYFDHNPDPERLARLQAALRAAGVPANRL